MTKPNKSVTVFGLGQIGLPLAILAAYSGFKTFGVDIDLEKISLLNNNTFSLENITLNSIFENSKKYQNLSFATNTDQKSDFFIICVPTPLNANNFADLSAVESCCLKISNLLKIGATIIIESTLPVGKSNYLKSIIEKQSGLKEGSDFFIVYSPERLLPGDAYNEIMFNTRIIGSDSTAGAIKAKSFYQAFVKAEICTTSIKCAELVKIAENSSRLVQIAFANELADVAEKLNLNSKEVIDLANKHPRVKILQPKLGVGGDCLGVHPIFLKENLGKIPPLISTSIKINKKRESIILEKINQRIMGLRKNAKVLFLGLTYKENVSDIRNSSALNIVKKCCSYFNFISFYIHDPTIIKSPIKKNNVSFLKESLLPLSEFDLIILLVNHSSYKPIYKNLLEHFNFLDPAQLIDEICSKKVIVKDLQL